MKSFIISSGFLSLLSVVACNPKKTTNGSDRQPLVKAPVVNRDDNKSQPKSETTVLSLRVPSIDGNGKSFIVEGYSIQVKKTSGSCTFTDTALTAKIPSASTLLSQTLTQKCDYKIQVSFGKLSPDGLSIAKDSVYLTNEAHDSNAETPLIVSQAEINEKASVTNNACFKVTAAGAKALGLVAGTCLSGSGTSVHPDPGAILPVANAFCTPHAVLPKVGTLAYLVLPVIPTTSEKSTRDLLLCAKSSYDYSVDVWNSNETTLYKKTVACVQVYVGFSQSNRAALYSLSIGQYTSEVQALVEAYNASSTLLRQTYGCP